MLVVPSKAITDLHDIVEERLQDETAEDRSALREQCHHDYLSDRLAEYCHRFFSELETRIPGDFHGTYRPDAEDTAGFDPSFVPFFHDTQSEIEAGLKKLEDENYLVGVGFRARDAGKPVELDERQSAFRAARRQEMAEGLSTYLAWRCEKDGHVVRTRQGNPIPYGDEPECPLDRFAEAYEALEKL